MDTIVLANILNRGNHSKINCRTVLLTVQASLTKTIEVFLSGTQRIQFSPEEQ